MRTEINIKCSHYYVSSSENTFFCVLITTLYSDHIYTLRKYIVYQYMKQADFLWNELTVLWKDLAELKNYA